LFIWNFFWEFQIQKNNLYPVKSLPRETSLLLLFNWGIAMKSEAHLTEAAKSSLSRPVESLPCEMLSLFLWGEGYSSGVAPADGTGVQIKETNKPMDVPMAPTNAPH